jgi:hypothetical protein
MPRELSDHAFQRTATSSKWNLKNRSDPLVHLPSEFCDHSFQTTTSRHLRRRKRLSASKSRRQVVVHSHRHRHLAPFHRRLLSPGRRVVLQNAHSQINRTVREQHPPHAEVFARASPTHLNKLRETIKGVRFTRRRRLSRWWSSLGRVRARWIAPHERRGSGETRSKRQME